MKTNMAEILVYLLQHLGFPVVLIAFGYIADHLSSQYLKDTIVRWISRQSTPPITTGRVRRFLKLFLDGFIHRIFGTRFLSLKFFSRTCVVSIVFLSFAVAFQFLYYPNESITQFRPFLSRPLEAAIFLSLVLIFNFSMDYLSNIITISLLRMAMHSGRIFDTLVVFVADVTLTVTLFTLVFPIGVTIDALIDELLSPVGRILIVEASKGSQVVAEERYAKTVSSMSQEGQPWNVKVFNIYGSFSDSYFIPESG